jgi:hypothetical protein
LLEEGQAARKALILLLVMMLIGYVVCYDELVLEGDADVHQGCDCCVLW